MKEVIWLSNVDSKYIPRLTGIDQTRIKKGAYLFFYIFVWVLSYFYLKNKLVSKKPILIGFISGILLLLLFDFLNDQEYFISINNERKYILTYNPNAFHVILKNDAFKINNNTGTIMKKDVLDKLIREKKIKVEKLVDYFNPLKHKKLDGNLWKHVSKPIDSGSDYNQLDDATFNYMVVIFTLGIVVSGISKIKLFYVLPWLILSCIFSLCSQSLFRWNSSYKQVLDEFILKQKAFILGISFGITSVISLFLS